MSAIVSLGNAFDDEHILQFNYFYFNTFSHSELEELSARDDDQTFRR